jgi:hypothetical protein
MGDDVDMGFTHIRDSDADIGVTGPHVRSQQFGNPSHGGNWKQYARPFLVLRPKDGPIGEKVMRFHYNNKIREIFGRRGGF